MRVAFAHHLSLRYNAGGERWIAEVANEFIKRGHQVEIHALPFTLSEFKPENAMNIKAKLNPNVKYEEAYFHFIRGVDVTYITYSPLNWLNFWIKGPKIGGMHTHAYWLPLNKSYGLLPNLAILVNMFTSRFELARFEVIHAILNEYPINHPDVRAIPNFVDLSIHKPSKTKPDLFTVGYASRKNWQKGFDIWEELKPLLESGGIKTMETGGLTDAQVGEFYNNCHVMFVPSRVDTFGLTIVEAILWGKCIPLVSTNPAHLALTLPLFYADTAEQAYRRILEIKDMWDTGAYYSYSNILYKQAHKFGKDIVMDQLEAMFEEVANQ